MPRYIRVPSDTYVFAKVDPSDTQATAANIMLKLASFRSYTFLMPTEEVSLDQVPAEARAHWGERPETASAPVASAADMASDEPIDLRWPGGSAPAAGDYLCRLPSATYARVAVPAEDIDGTWKAVKAELRSPRSASIGAPEVYPIRPADAPADLHRWLTYGASDRVVVPLWPEQYIDEPDKAVAWMNLPRTLEQVLPFEGAYVRVVAAHPRHVRGMLCRRWHVRRDDKAGLGTVYGKYPVDVAVAVPSAKRTPHIHSFDEIKMQDWRPGIVFYNDKADDGCPRDYLGERLEPFRSDGWVNARTWRQWVED
jgi:hypothetical protein